MVIKNKQLKNFLADTGLVDIKKLNEALKEAEKSKQPLGDILLKQKLITNTELKKVMAYIYGIPFVDLTKEKIPKDILQIIPQPVAKKYNVVAFKKIKDELSVAMLDPDDLQTIDFIKKKSGLKIIPCLSTEESINAVLRQYEKSLEAEFGDMISKEETEELTKGVKEGENEKQNASKKDLEEIAEDVPVVKIVDTLLKHAILESVSDIHIEPGEKEVIVRFRIDGILHDAMILPKKLAAGIVARVKVLSNLKLDEHRLPQDGRFKIQKDEYKISFRVSILPVFDGEKIVMRLLDESSKGLTLEQMGIEGKMLELVHREIKRPNGIILITGPTGSGKTTTLYTILDILNTPEVNISTVEDPVEYRMARINQTQVKAKIGMTFAAALRSLLRQDPDIIMVGEIRDKETLEIALHAAMTGHMVLSTLHTNSAAASLPRMLDMGAEPFLIASSVNLIVAQRLVRRICNDCKEKYNLSEKEVENLNKSFKLDEIFDFLKNNKETKKYLKGKKSWTEVDFYRPKKNCPDCSGGYKGRVGIYEMLKVDDDIKKLVQESASTEEIEEKAKENGMITLAEDGFVKIIKGITTIEEVLRVTAE